MEAEAAVGDEAAAAGESSEAPVGRAESDGGEVAFAGLRIVRASLTSGVRFEREAQASQASCARARAGDPRAGRFGRAAGGGTSASRGTAKATRRMPLIYVPVLVRERW